MKWYNGVVVSFNISTKEHEVAYNGEENHCQKVNDHEVAKLTCTINKSNCFKAITLLNRC